ncbi:hypothetical protein PISMIDRAFT_678331 [Pisolithus microcarpus 441]|uniref:Uncharacterized protein n=1 Tax=Pisolithus microcarpus 441 TaxID=765257 RepID=A0A0C9ZEV8_9AGAM|nr:hypothetical protein PISMIDRAFT_678331 [Pisolithus microcarpus 441]
MSSPELQTTTAEKFDKKKDKSSKKKKTKPTPVTIAELGKNEGDNPHWAYKPPPGAILVDHSVDPGPFEWDTVRNNDDLELWLIRVPDSIKAQHLEGVEIDRPVSSRTARVGSLTRKNVVHDIWSAGDGETDFIGGEELRCLSCLLPRKKKKGKLSIAPKAIARHIVISARQAVPTVPRLQPIIHQNPPRPSYPKDVLKHQFVPYGARSQSGIFTTEESMDIEGVAPPDVISEKPRQEVPQVTEMESKEKKRKKEGESPKKSKKHKSKD